MAQKPIEMGFLSGLTGISFPGNIILVLQGMSTTAGPPNDDARLYGQAFDFQLPTGPSGPIGQLSVAAFEYPTGPTGGPTGPTGGPTGPTGGPTGPTGLYSGATGSTWPVSLVSPFSTSMLTNLQAWGPASTWGPTGNTGTGTPTTLNGVGFLNITLAKKQLLKANLKANLKNSFATAEILISPCAPTTATYPTFTGWYSLFTETGEDPLIWFTNSSTTIPGYPFAPPDAVDVLTYFGSVEAFNLLMTTPGATGATGSANYYLEPPNDVAPTEAICQIQCNYLNTLSAPFWVPFQLNYPGGVITLGGCSWNVTASLFSGQKNFPVKKGIATLPKGLISSIKLAGSNNATQATLTAKVNLGTNKLTFTQS